MQNSKRKNHYRLPVTDYRLLSQGGFTLIEIVLILFLTGITFTAIYGLFASNVKHNTESRYEIIASNLAQEGIEIIRNRRDEIIMQGNAIDDIGIFVSLPTSNCKPYYVAGWLVAILGVDGGFCSNIPFFTKPEVCFDNGIYYNCVLSTAKKTPFKRECSTDDLDTDGDGDVDTLDITCTVSWNSFVDPGISRSVEATSIMTDWAAE